ncbi:hypothetical protein G5C51_23155 [Streptomyces sp. A7024]|uniref:Secreted protein n=1 Tax=Streptomyces coryli TaxID=1128680 RepID=A0A6G4U4X7_9ACTN|nr:hypothetical protein [Streptomyces coryli]
MAILTAAAALSATALVGCSAVDKALDCAQLATEISKDVEQLQDVVGGAGESPQAAQDALDKIDKDLDKFSDKSDNADVGKAVEDLQTAVNNAQKSAEGGDPTPDLSGITSAAGELSKVCTS